MSLRLIPRVRVNYGFSDLIRALLTSERKQTTVHECEAVLSSFFDGEYVCLVPSARDAIYELLIRLPQKIVVLPAFTCIAVVEAVRLAGKEMLFSKTDSFSYNSDYLDDITGECIVLATHQYGLPCNIERIAAKCQEVGAVLIEDCATSLGTTVKGKKTGTFGQYAMVSFNASKLINVPPAAGVLVSKEKELVDSINRKAEWRMSDVVFKSKSLIRGLAYVITKNTFAYKLFHYLAIDSKGKFQKTEHEKPAEAKTSLYSYRFSEWQAVILLRQLKRLDELFEMRREFYEYYDEHIHNPLVQKPPVDEKAVCCRYAIQVENRDAFYRQCVKRGVDMDFSHCSLCCPDGFKDEHIMASRILNLPYYFDLTEKERNKIIDTVNNISF